MHVYHACRGKRGPAFGVVWGQRKTMRWGPDAAIDRVWVSPSHLYAHVDDDGNARGRMDLLV